MLYIHRELNPVRLIFNVVSSNCKRYILKIRCKQPGWSISVIPLIARLKRMDYPEWRAIHKSTFVFVSGTAQAVLEVSVYMI